MVVQPQGLFRTTLEHNENSNSALVVRKGESLEDSLKNNAHSNQLEAQVQISIYA